MDLYEGARSIALRRDLDAMSIFYEERSAARLCKQLELRRPPVPGQCFFFHGLVLSDCEHFVIDFVTKRQREKCFGCDVVLHIGVRIPQNYIVRNTRLMGKWGPEENASHSPFKLKRGNVFWIQVLLTDDSFYISVNDYHFAKYYYRMPYRWIAGVEVRGDVSDVIVQIFYLTEYPIRVGHSKASPIPYRADALEDMGKPQGHTIPFAWLHIDGHQSDKYPETELRMPYFGRLPDPDKLIDGRALRIEGRVQLMPHSFNVALQLGQNIWPQPTVSLLFSPSFLRNSRAKLGKAIITRSAHIKGSWVSREVSSLHTHLGPGKAFVLIIACRRHCYELFVNSFSLLTFKHQMNPADVDIVRIWGDVKLWSVVVEKFKSSFSSHSRGIGLLGRKKSSA